VGSKVGSGSQAEVFEGTLEGTHVAVKRIASSRLEQNSKSRTDLVRELMIMAKTSHPNLVRLMGACEQRIVGSFDIVLEFCRGGTLFQRLHIDDADLVIWQQHKMATDVACGMGYLHRFDPLIIHRDLKSLNVLLSFPVLCVHDIPHAKITDFGFAKMASLRWRGSELAGAQPESGIASVTHTPSLTSKLSSPAWSRCRSPAYSDAQKRKEIGPIGEQSGEIVVSSASGESKESPERGAIGSRHSMESPVRKARSSFTSDAVGPSSTESSTTFVRPGSTIKTAMTAGVGTLQWMAPEIMSGSTDYTSKVDVYAFGMLLFEIMSREPPFVDFDNGELKTLVPRGVRPEVPPDVPRFYITMSESCWDSEPELRPGFDSLMLDLQEYGQLKFSLAH